ncbi:MAG: transposase [Lachnospiraceae bacterium]|nr:transposase [Lachnospiraceae bacterium]
MYMDYEIDIPDVPGKINRVKKGNTTYIRYVVGRTYHPDKKYNIPDQRIIGKRSEHNPDMMIPNENFLKYFGDVELPDQRRNTNRSSCLRIGTFLVIREIIENYELSQILPKYFGVKDSGLLLDLAAYSITAENNAAQYYPDYAFNHPLFTKGMHIYSDSKISEFFASVTDDQRIGFLNEWNANRDHREKIYISYDSTNKNCQAGELELVEFGHPKVDKGLPVFNYSIAYDTDNREPLFYEQYPGSIVDISQLQFMLQKVQGYGYRQVGFILDRGYFCKENIQYMDQCGYDFIIMVKGMNSLVRDLILENKGKFENIREHSIRQYKCSGMTVKKQLYASDEQERYFHLYYSDQKACAEHEQVEAKIDRMTKYLNSIKGQKVNVGDGFKEYFHLEIYEQDGTFLYAREKTETVQREIDLGGYFVIVTSKKMSAKEALELYKSRDVSEKLFRGDKSYLGNRSLRVQSDEAASAKIFTEFIAMIIRCRMYTHLKDEMEKLDKKPNFMTVPAAIRELDKLEMIRQTDGKYRLDHAVTATQKTILNAFGMDASFVRKSANELSEILMNYEKEVTGED